jgi:cell fate (sporulation/competence/biofilm development) regulator YlbF (YheA/YmcA/DUF963 family)
MFLNDLELAPASVVMQSARDFAVALASTPQFEAFEQASIRLREDKHAQAAMQAFQEKQQSLQALLLLNAVGPDDQAALNQLREAFLQQPSVIAYQEAEANLRGLCQETSGMLSQYIGLDFATVCGSGCC